MKKFILRRKATITERVEIEAEDWDDAERVLGDKGDELEWAEEITLYSDSIEFIGEESTNPPELLTQP